MLTIALTIELLFLSLSVSATLSQANVSRAKVMTTTLGIASLLLLAFTVGLLISNSLVAAFSVFGFVSASTKRNVYVAVGALAAIFSLFVGFFFITGQGAELPDLQQLLDKIFGTTQPRT